ncbi:hypothetical protein [Saccharothrix yanglingensis]|uniref:Uncharacterized protein n=1 Tax=Saccharothrix yanglingensis TaxID=659496 RepID=A0ABU0X053_9PSEU|nr:hypothetical protein [Saccharothrix yanglingensis]MDQ2585505.1 hypothetical protein [Saccharothrix yanglingensis]
MKQLMPAIAGTVLLAALGVTTVVLGGADDSPGLQLIGVLLVVGAVVLAVRSVRNARRAG